MAVRAVVQGGERLYREGIAAVLAEEPDFEVVGLCVTAAEVRALVREHRPDVVILQADDADADACRLAVTLRRRQGTLRLIGLYRSVDGLRAHGAYRAGFAALLSYQHGLKELLDALRGTGRRRALPPVTPTARLQPRDRRLRVTARQLEVLRLVSLGETTGEIGHRLGISAKTVAHHKQNIFGRLGAQNQAHAVSIAMHRGLLPPNLALDPGGQGTAGVAAWFR